MANHLKTNLNTITQIFIANPLEILTKDTLCYNSMTELSVNNFVKNKRNERARKKLG